MSETLSQSTFLLRIQISLIFVRTAVIFPYSLWIKYLPCKLSALLDFFPPWRYWDKKLVRYKETKTGLVPAALKKSKGPAGKNDWISLFPFFLQKLSTSSETIISLNGGPSSRSTNHHRSGFQAPREHTVLGLGVSSWYFQEMGQFQYLHRATVL